MALGYIETKLDRANLEKITRLNNPNVVAFLNKYLPIVQPKNVFVCDGSPEDIAHVRAEAVRNNEEIALSGNFTLHYDNYFDQGRDKEVTKYLLPGSEAVLGENINWMDRQSGLDEVLGLMKGGSSDRTAYVMFFCLGPLDSEFSNISCQITDSSYVGHSEIILYRYGYEMFKDASRPFFKFVHTQGELETFNCKVGSKRVTFKVSKYMDKKRIYIDLNDKIVFSVNTQYGGNTIGLKKLSMRLAIHKAAKENWLCEHMLVMGVKGPKDRVSYFTGAYPSMCGKTSTAMLPGEKIVGDDIAYLRARGGKAYAVNVEKGIFGIIDGVNAKDDPLIFKKLHDDSEEVIFSNVLLKDGMKVYWSGMDKSPVPPSGVNFSGEWVPGKKGPDGKDTPPSHKNARFTITINTFENADNEMLDEKKGCLVSGYIYGGRDMDTSVPVEQAFDWDHGIVYYGAALESETTAATVGQAGVRVFNPMSNIDFLSVPIGKYIKMNLDFGYGLKQKPAIFHVNYFLQDGKGNWLNERTDKSVWLKWMELRVHGDVAAYKTPTGFVPVYDDLKKLFKDMLNKEYTRDQYIQQFSARVDKHLDKIARIRKIYEKENAWIKANSKDASHHVPDVLFKVLDEQEVRLKEVQAKSGSLVSPEAFPRA